MRCVFLSKFVTCFHSLTCPFGNEQTLQASCFNTTHDVFSLKKLNPDPPQLANRLSRPERDHNVSFFLSLFAEGLFDNVPLAFSLSHSSKIVP